MFRLAHFSDPHLAGWHQPGPGSLFGKRFFGYLSWRFRRQGVHLTSILDALVTDLKAAAPDHIAITGDIVNISLPEEFARATSWLATIGAAEQLTVIPGNHDAYVGMPWHDTIGQWGAYMNDPQPGKASDNLGPDMFPFVRIRNRVALIGASSACPMPISSAGGRLGTAQIGRLRERLHELGQRGLFRVLLIHHPPYGNHKHRRKELEDIAELRAAVAGTGLELILHGHLHQSSLQSIPTSEGNAPVIGVASASARAWHGKDPARYHIYSIEPAGTGWRVGVEIRSLNEARDGFERTSAFELLLPMPGTGLPHPGTRAAA